ncbi:hypothetical protein [Hymenobacter latericus]|uniref:hypothetical protein n=1 Tax=Hymenobacter sp. YIM 151858-1 TaxID=2987688 RepID=UPI0022280453|nr:hypothetical protein [Hymenobacter sp. YIM 151858-1]UYZ58144.1 hypothetical protein OIS50_13880 [Hymenobacter sp. YIM 151858-1]
MIDNHVYRQFAWNTIIVIESLPQKERTGQELVNSILGRRAEQHGFLCGYCNVYSAEDFIGALEEVKSGAKEDGFLPIIHIEAHGSNQGLEMESGEVITWNILGLHLRHINTLTKNNLLVVLGACYGIEIWQQITVITRAPFWGVLAPLEKVSEATAHESFVNFYEKITDPKFDDFVEAVRAMNQFIDPPVFQFIDSQELFDLAWKSFKEEFDTEQKINLMVDYLIENGNVHPSVDKVQLRNYWIQIFKLGDEGKHHVFNFYMMLDK